MTLDQIQSFIRSNGFAWPGCYQMALLMADGEVIDAQSTRENYRIVRRAMQSPGSDRQWEPREVFIYWEGAPIECAHSGRSIPSAYGETEEAAA